ncbi:MAG: hypothetical protein HQL29_01875 [Candidatus Omnitrophica bacterium]|nr:hypothetical protein [Candidatus Omnitrophota bacterium]
MKTLLLITGAGASFDMVSGQLRHGLVNESHRPLLTREIFSMRLEGHVTNDLLHRSERAMYVAADFTARYEVGGGKNLEQYLDELKNSSIISMQDHYLVIPIFLRELFLDISNAYLESGSNVQATNYYRLLMDFEMGKYERLIWFNLNYDLFGDRAIQNFMGNKQLFLKMSDYVNIKTKGGKEIYYLKPHGSVDWVHRIVPQNDTYIGNPIFYNENDIKIGNIPKNFYANYISREIMTESEFDVHVKTGGKYPAISVPIGKYTPLKADHINMVKPYLKNETDILCVGFSALDDDIFEIINNEIVETNKLLIITGDSDADDVIKRFKKKCSHKKLFEDTDIIFREGFSRFINTRSKTWL